VGQAREPALCQLFRHTRPWPIQAGQSVYLSTVQDGGRKLATCMLVRKVTRALIGCKETRSVGAQL